MTVISTMASPKNSELHPYAERKEDSQVTVTFAIDGIISGNRGVGVVLAKQEDEFRMCRQSFVGRESRACAYIGGASTRPFTWEIKRAAPNQSRRARWPPSSP